MTEEKLLPCPFCGAKPTIHKNRDSMGQCVVIRCENNDCVTRDLITVEKFNMKLAIDAWNTRHQLKRKE